MESRKSFCCAQSLCAHRERTKREHALTSLQSAIENLESKMSAVLVVQRIEQGFPKAKRTFLQQFASVMSSAQTAAFKPVEVLLRSSRVIRNLPIFTLPGDTTGDTKTLRPFCYWAATSAHANNLEKHSAASVRRGDC